MIIQDFNDKVNNYDDDYIFQDITCNWSDCHHRPYINGLIKLGYLKRIKRDKLQKIKNIPNDFSVKKVKELSKGLTLPKYDYTVYDSYWSILVHIINESDSDNIIIRKEHFNNSLYCWYSTSKTIRSYLGQLEQLKYVDYIERVYLGPHKSLEFLSFKIKRLNKIPEKLSNNKVKKYLYDKYYKRKRKIEKLKINI